jgi:hypothetical protein
MEDVYSAAPYVLASKYSPVIADDGSEAWYFFTYLQAKGAKGSRQNRSMVVDGLLWSWHGEHSSKPVTSALRAGHKVGYRHPFTFARRDKEGTLIRSGWLMTEFGISEKDLKRPVLCKIYRTNRDNKVKRRHTVHSSDGKRRRIDHPTVSCTSRQTPECPPLSQTNIDKQSARFFTPEHPRGDQLLMKFLQPRLASGVGIHEVSNVYAVSPVELARAYPATISADGECCWYFYTCSHSEAACVPQSANWTSMLEPQRPVLDSYGDVIGKVQKVNYFDAGDSNQSSDCDMMFMGYSMLEFSMKNCTPEGVVLCKMTSSKKKAAEQGYEQNNLKLSYCLEFCLLYYS